jgi:hypothetical protein
LHVCGLDTVGLFHTHVFQTATFVIKPGRYCGENRSFAFDRTLVCATVSFSFLAIYFRCVTHPKWPLEVVRISFTPDVTLVKVRPKPAW